MALSMISSPINFTSWAIVKRVWWNSSKQNAHADHHHQDTSLHLAKLLVLDFSCSQKSFFLSRCQSLWPCILPWCASKAHPRSANALFASPLSLGYQTMHLNNFPYPTNLYFSRSVSLSFVFLALIAPCIYQSFVTLFDGCVSNLVACCRCIKIASPGNLSASLFFFGLATRDPRQILCIIFGVFLYY